MIRYLYAIINDGPKDPLALIIKVVLWVLSIVYLLIVKIRMLLYRMRMIRRVRLSSPVISIGNITWGGTGKTPLAEYICRYLVSKGKSVGLLTRGYGSDEDRYLSESLQGVSVIVDSNRYKGATRAQQGRDFDIFILDDGFQHMRLRRQLDIVTINCADPFGCGQLLPCGILREPISHLFRADIIVLTKSDLVSEDRIKYIRDRLARIKPAMPVFESSHNPQELYNTAGERLQLGYIDAKRVCAVSGLADNGSFYSSLEHIGARVAKKIPFMDHHIYTRQDMVYINEECKRGCIGTIVTTEKDWIKLRELIDPAAGIELLVLKVTLKLKDEEEFFRRLYSILSG